MKTQSIRYGENGGVEIIDIDVSAPQAGEVQVQSAACGVCAWDLATFRDGGYAPPGHEGVGYVTKVGSGVPDIEAGMRVASVALGFDCYLLSKQIFLHNILSHRDPQSRNVSDSDITVLLGPRIADQFMLHRGFMGLKIRAIGMR